MQRPPPPPSSASFAPLGFGINAGYGEATLVPLAVEVAALGYGSLWVNDSARPDADGLADLGVVARAASGIELGIGVVPLDRRPPESIAAAVRRLELPIDRLRLGVGSGAEAGRPLALVRDGLAALRDLLPGVRVFVAALGPRMCELAGEHADGVLLNWALPQRIGWARGHVAAGAARGGRIDGAVEVWAYVRAAVGPPTGARTRLGDEAARYERSPAYARQFAAMGVPLERVGVANIVHNAVLSGR